MRKSRISSENQLRLIMECRSSGLTDYQWCLEHGIKPGTFYNWVRRLRKSGCPDIPAPSGLRHHPGQEIVKVEIAAPACTGHNSVIQPGERETVMEIVLDGVSVRVSNGTEPALLACVIRTLRDGIC